MMVSAKGRYALCVLIDLAQHTGDGCVSLSDVSRRQGVSLKYLESIASLLHKAGLLISRRGKNGGYALARPAEEITVSEVLLLTEGSLSPTLCVDCENVCERAALRLTMPMWQELDRVIDSFLSGITVAGLAEGWLEDAP